MKIALLSNIGIDTLTYRIAKKYDIYKPHGYNVWMQELINTNSSFYTSDVTDCFVLVDGNHLQNTVDDASACIKNAAIHLPGCNFYVSTIDCHTNEIQPLKNVETKRETEYKWHLCMDTLAKELSNVYVLDLKNMLEQYGRDQCYSPKMWYISGNPYTAFFEKKIIEEIETILRARYNARKKCLVLDLDNTLWGGVVGEDGISGIQLDETKEGARFKDFQNKLKQIKNAGIVLAIASKNNLADAKEAFLHPQMVLTWDDFVIHKTNWQPKSQSITEIAKELNICIDSIVFVDDNPLEREEVKQHLPDVSVAEFPADTCKLSQFADKLFKQYFYTLYLAEEDKNRSEMYVENISRKQFEQKFTNIDEFLSNMAITLKMQPPTIDMLPRICQLVQKTNQFNLTTKRYNEQELRKMMKNSDYIIFTGSVADKFGDNGLTLLLIAKKIQERTMDIDTFLMSCRVMGRMVEYAALSYFEDFITSNGFDMVHASYIPTLKNEPVMKFYESLGYTLNHIHPDGTKEYNVSLKKKKTLKPHYVKLI